MTSASDPRLQAAAAAQRQAEEALDKSERRYRALVEHSLGLICVHDLDGRLIAINPAASRSLGYEPGQEPGDSVRDFLVAETQPLFDAYLARIRDAGKDAGLMRVTARDGDERIWMYSNILYGGDGEPYVLGHALDITERVRAQRALRDQEQALHRAYDALEARVRERTHELMVTNARLEAEIAERRHAEDTREQALLRERDALAFITHITEEFSTVTDAPALFEALSRLPVPFLADASLLHVLNDDGSLRTLAGPHVDADREPALDSLAGLTAGLPVPGSALAAVFDDYAPRTLAGTSRELSGRYAGDDRATSVLQGLGVRCITVLPVVVDQRPVAAWSLMSVSADELGASELSLAADVVRRFRLAHERVRLLHGAREANRLKEEFLSTLSHELRTPLNAVLGWSRMLRAAAVEPAVARGLEIIERNADAQARLIEEILDVSRIVTGKLQLQFGSVAVTEIVRAAVDAIRPSAEGRRLRLVEHYDGPDHVRGDAHRLRQVATNLLSNAVKFTDADGTITIVVRSSGAGVEIEVADTGIGIRREVLPFVFDRFRQADSSTTRRHGGLGLGLALVRQIVDLHGGHVSAYSAGELHGSRFIVWLPLAVDTETASPEPRVDALDPQDATSLRHRLILVVDDDADTRDLLAVLLKGAGARVTTVSTSRAAMEAIGRELPDLVIADIGMPDEDGYVFVGRMRTLAPDRGGRLPAIALTAYARAEDRERALAAGFDRHVVKPVDPTVLLRVVTNMLMGTVPILRKA